MWCTDWPNPPLLYVVADVSIAVIYREEGEALLQLLNMSIEIKRLSI